jgi:putative ATP-dependent endonuclease of OLD family
MRLVSFSATNFRSITTAHKIPIGDSTVLIGRNNEGKSNFLRALNIAMKALDAHAKKGSSRLNNSRDDQQYQWSRDFPISLQSGKGQNVSTFKLEFSLDENEISDFQAAIGSTLNGNLPIQITFGKDAAPAVKVKKQGPGGKALSAKSTDIAKYIADRIRFVYIPAVRTEEAALLSLSSSIIPFDDLSRTCN